MSVLHGTTRCSEWPELVAGHDEDGLVTMTVTAERAEVVDVVLDPDWRRVIASADLAATVLRAFRTAQAAAIAWQLEHPTTVAPTVPEAAGEDDSTAPRYVQNLILTVLHQLDAYAARVARVRSSRFKALSPKQAVVVLSSGGQVDEVDIDPEWARRAPAADLAREIRAAFIEVQSRSAALIAEVGGPSREMTELTGLVRDPTRFLGLLGMRVERTEKS